MILSCFYHSVPSGHTSQAADNSERTRPEPCTDGLSPRHSHSDSVTPAAKPDSPADGANPSPLQPDHQGLSEVTNPEDSQQSVVGPDVDLTKNKPDEVGRCVSPSAFDVLYVYHKIPAAHTPPAVRNTMRAPALEQVRFVKTLIVTACVRFDVCTFMTSVPQQVRLDNTLMTSLLPHVRLDSTLMTFALQQMGFLKTYPTNEIF